jgi:hypothetical protein
MAGEGAGRASVGAAAAVGAAAVGAVGAAAVGAVGASVDMLNGGAWLRVQDGAQVRQVRAGSRRNTPPEYSSSCLI